MRITINDVARMAGVSTSTVSRALSDHPNISVKTKDRIKQAAEELNYFPHAIAKSLANNSTKTMGLILNTEADLFVKNPFFVQVLSGVSQYVKDHGYNVVLAFNRNEDENLNAAMKYVSSRSVDGIILFTSRYNDKCIRYLKDKHFPFSIIGRPDDTEKVFWVDNDNFQATYQITDYLVMRGHTSIAYIGGPQCMNVSKDRLEGFKRALFIHGIAFQSDIIFEDCDFSDAHGYACMKKMISNWEEGQTRPTAVITCDDMQAIGAIRALCENGIRDITVTGFNNIPIGSYQKPPLTSVEVNASQLGFYAAKLLHNNLEMLKGPTHYIVPTTLVERMLTLMEERKA